MLSGRAAFRTHVIVPFTPFHFGPATLVKGVAPRAFSLTAFVASQVVIDLESGYYLFRGAWPVHRLFHTIPVAVVVGLVSGALVWLAGSRLSPSIHREVQAEVRPIPALVGGLTGGLSHPLLDAIMHSDVEPFWPISSANPLLGSFDLSPLHVFCLATGVVGVVFLGVRAHGQS